MQKHNEYSNEPKHKEENSYFFIINTQLTFEVPSSRT
jgi:hypothetical protein